MDTGRLLDEGARWIVTIPSAETVDSHTEYVVKVEQQLQADFKCAIDSNSSPSETNNKSSISPSENSWKLKHRYTDFRNLNSSLEQLTCEKDILQFPGKKVTGNMDRDFIASRRVSLERFLQNVVRHTLLRNTLVVRQFLDPRNYTQNFKDIHLQNVTMCFRGIGNFEIIKPIPGVGCRIKKDYFQVRFVIEGYTKKADELWLDWLDYGPEMAFSGDSVLDQKALQSISKSLQQLEHPYIYPNEAIEFHETGVIAIKKFSSKGSLRDVLTNSKPKDQFYKKYFPSTIMSNGKKATRKFELNDVRTIGRQLLEGIKFLHDKGIGHGNLHCGNILFNGAKSIFQISEIENYFAGVSCNMRQEVIRLKAPSQSVESFDVFCFGHMLYEMSTGKPFYFKADSYTSNDVLSTSYNTSVIEGRDVLPPQLPDSLKSIIQSIISVDACKDPTSYPSIKDLLQDPFFNEVSSDGSKDGTRPYLKFSLNSKEALSKYKESIRKQLQIDYTKAMTIRAEAKRLEILQSKEGRKRRLKNKKTTGAVDNQSTLQTGNSVATKPETKEQNINKQAVNGSNQTIREGVAPPPPPPPPPPAIIDANEDDYRLPTNSNVPNGNDNNMRTALLGSISGFNKGKLKKCETIDKSRPKI